MATEMSSTTCLYFGGIDGYTLLRFSVDRMLNYHYLTFLRVSFVRGVKLPNFVEHDMIIHVAVAASCRCRAVGGRVAV